MSRKTPVLLCREAHLVEILPSAPPLSPLQSPTFSIPPSLREHLDEAAGHLHAGRTVAFPTETVYGLGASSLNPSAVQRIYQIKNRPSDNPLIIHVSSLDMLERLLPSKDQYQVSELYRALMDAFWPGPLTLLFPSPHPPPVPAPQTNAIRMPNHPLALALIHRSDLPLSAPSANSSGRPSPTQAQHVYNDLNGADGLGCILDGGDCAVGVESTVVNGLGWNAGDGGVVDILRPGGLGVEEIARVVDRVDGAKGATRILVHGQPWQRNAEASSSRLSRPTSVSANGTGGALPSAPGLKYRHYSPRIPVYLLLPSNTFPRPTSLAPTEDVAPATLVRTLAKRLQENGGRPRFGLLHYDESPLSRTLLSDDPQDIVPISLGPNAETAAQRLFSGMLRLEGSISPLAAPRIVDPCPAVDAILVEGCSDEGLGLAVMERVGKAVGGGGALGSLDVGEQSGNGRFWVQV